MANYTVNTTADFPGQASVGDTAFVTVAGLNYKYDGQGWFPLPTSPGTAIGYATGAGGAVTQSTTKATSVTINKPCGSITLVNSALAAGAIVGFNVSNSLVVATDVILVQHDSVGTVGAYTVIGNSASAGSFRVTVRNNTASNLSEAIILRFAVIKAVVS